MNGWPLLAVIFDMDGVITATVELHYQAWQQALALCGITFTRAENDGLRSLTRNESLRRILNGRELSDSDRQLILTRKNEVFLQGVERMTPQDLLPGVRDLMEEIRASGIKIGIASASSNTRPVLDRLGVLPLIDTVVDANTVRDSKPAPEVYLRTADFLEVRSQDCLALDDSAAGIQAAVRAGMCAIGVGPHAMDVAAQTNLDDLANADLLTLRTAHQAWWESLRTV